MRCGEFVKDIATGYQGVVKSMSQFVRAFVRPTADAVPLAVDKQNLYSLAYILI
jgi:hypothetical protein